jgi:DNA modification methylase
MFKPYYTDPAGIVIYHGDCREFLAAYGCLRVDLVLTSPPYNIGNAQHTGNRRHKAYHDDLPEAEYQAVQQQVLTSLYGVVVDDGSLLYNHKNRIKDGVTITPYTWLLQTPWLLKQELVWFNGSQNFDKIRFYPMTERVYWLTKKATTQLNNVINHHDLFDWSAVGTNGEHTRAFPYTMASELIACFPSAQTILDPYCGSGTTLRAAKDLGRKAIGIEIEERYCEIAAKRLQQEVLPMGVTL